ncbi:DUF11 domain-containing protein [Arthrobacter sp. ISL-48]|uniref:DUF7507 domain-containing protein n=1 Tax=Arthrobacter sp. ISL-48 TaxID=2819110 RepID=UPI001BE87A10|nr:DUF11 domain-containing protein [Arthrobacter sp. ISL-48]MBT2534412.1 DUF11 domain-containing protein [Arthrobacter sp. ISL-48]
MAPAEAAPGTPGTPGAPSLIYSEDFQNAPVTGATNIAAYTSTTGATYTASPVYQSAQQCNGTIFGHQATNAALATAQFCSSSWWPTARTVPAAIGQHAGMADPNTNLAVAEQTSGGSTNYTGVMLEGSGINVAGTGRFVTFSLDVGNLCNIGLQALDRFYLMDGATPIALNATDYNICADPNRETFTVDGNVVSVGTFTGNRAALVTNPTVGFRVTNQQPSGAGNDQAFDNFKILDVTPQLDKSFSPASLPVGAKSTLTLTVTNTDELAAKNGWSFTDALPAGLTVADGAAATTCPAGVVTAPAGATSVAVTGNLDAGMAACTVTVNVTAAAAGAFTNGPANVTGTGINPPGDSTVQFVEQPWACDASGYLFQSPNFPAGPHLVQQVDLVTGANSTAFELPSHVNAAGYNTLDNFFYGTTATGHLVRVGANGSLTDLGIPAGTTGTLSLVGDFDNAGHYWVTANGVNNTVYEIDLAPGSATYGTVVNTVVRTVPAGVVASADWGYIDGAFYSTASDTTGNVLLRFDPATGASTVVGPMNGPDGTQFTGLAAGAVYVDAGGYLYASNNATGNIYRITPTTGATILLSAGPAAAGNDGARCALAPIPTLTVTKTVEGRQAPVDQFTVGLQNAGGTVLTSATTTGTATTVSTTNQPVSQGATYTITDTMAAGSASGINAYNAGVTCTNIASGDAVPAEGNGPWTFTVPDAAAFTCEVTNAPVDVSVGLVKSADQAAMENIEPGQIITYTFAFTNTGDVPLTDIRIDEGAFTGTGNAPVAICPAGTVAPDATVTCTATYTATQDDVDAGSISNTASGTGTPPEGFPVPPVSPPSTVVVPAPPAPAITVVKTADEAAQADLAVGQEITYSFLVTNTGNVTLEDVTVNEGNFSGAGELSDVTCPAEAARLAPAAAITCTATYSVVQADVDAGSITNTATATGVPPGTTPPPVSSPSGVTVPTPNAPAMTVLKTASTDKATTGGQVLTYSFFLTNTGNVTLTNVSAVEGEFSGTGDLSAVNCPAEAASLAPAMSVTCTATYTVTLADLNAGTITNTATGTGTTPAGGAITSAPSTAKLAAQAPVSAVNFAGNLANTGLDAGPLALGALVLFLLGGSTLAAAKLRRRQS